MMKSIPSTWDETIVLPPSEIGEIAVFARRSGRTWFLAVLNGLTTRTVKIPLSFLGDNEYRTMLLRDNKDDAAALEVEKKSLKRSDSLAIDLPAGGGFIARFSKQ
jgi:alpha-glucosidase